MLTRIDWEGIELHQQATATRPPRSAELRGSPGKHPDSNKFFLLTMASATFAQIGSSLSNLRVAK
jgi:hypothetical protein